MGRDRVLVDGDYVSDGRGGRQTTTTAAPKCYHALRTALNTWPGRASRGAAFAELERKDSDEEAARMEDMTRVALQPIVDEGGISDLEIETGRDQLGRRVVQWTARDVQSGQIISGTETRPWGV
jgi:hypothetical protein